MATDLAMVDKNVAGPIQQEMGAPTTETAEIDTQCDEAVTWQAIARKFEESAEDQDLDIYQMCAWMHRQDSIPKTKKYFYYFKAMVCALIQVPGLMIFIYVQFNGIFSEGGIGFCAMRSGKTIDLVQVLCVLFAVFISAKMGGIISDIGKRGLYNMNWWNDGMNCPPFCCRRWAFFGGYTNVTATLFAIYGSYLVLYVSEDILDVVLNAVALFFITDVDDFMLDKADYQRLQNWFKNTYKEEEVCRCNGKYEEMDCCASFMTRRILTPTHVFFTWLGFGGAIFAPVWIAICH